MLKRTQFGEGRAANLMNMPSIHWSPAVPVRAVTSLYPRSIISTQRIRRSRFPLPDLELVAVAFMLLVLRATDP